jgi:hypothetical protein
LDLPTHFFFGFAVGLVFFGHPEIALLIALGALLPDLDREYWFTPKRVYADEQIHRAGLHNVFMMGLTYLVSPSLSLGVFLHVLQDSFTTVKDRGVEWFFPVTRLVKRGLFDSQGNPQPQDPKEKVYFYQQDPKGLVNKADPDLREYGCDPIPWRRVYGFAQNSQMLDKGFLFGSIAVILIWFFAPGNALHLSTWSSYPMMDYGTILVGFFAIAVLFFAGEMDRRDKTPRFGKLNVIKYPMFFLGLGLFGYWGFLFANQISKNLMIVFSNPVAIIMGVILVPLVIIGMIKWKTSKRDTPAVV